MDAPPVEGASASRRWRFGCSRRAPQGLHRRSGSPPRTGPVILEKGLWSAGLKHPCSSRHCDAIVLGGRHLPPESLRRHQQVFGGHRPFPGASIPRPRRTGCCRRPEQEPGAQVDGASRSEVYCCCSGCSGPGDLWLMERQMGQNPSPWLTFEVDAHSQSPVRFHYSDHTATSPSTFQAVREARIRLAPRSSGRPPATRFVPGLPTSCHRHLATGSATWSRWICTGSFWEKRPSSTRMHRPLDKATPIDSRVTMRTRRPSHFTQIPQAPSGSRNAVPACCPLWKSFGSAWARRFGRPANVRGQRRRPNERQRFAATTRRCGDMYLSASISFRRHSRHLASVERHINDSERPGTEPGRPPPWQSLQMEATMGRGRLMPELRHRHLAQMVPWADWIAHHELRLSALRTSPPPKALDVQLGDTTVFYRAQQRRRHPRCRSNRAHTTLGTAERDSPNRHSPRHPDRRPEVFGPSRHELNGGGRSKNGPMPCNSSGSDCPDRSSTSGQNLITLRAGWGWNDGEESSWRTGHF